MSTNRWTTPPVQALRAGPGFDLATFDPSATPGWDGSRDDGEERMVEQGQRLTDLQEMLYAEGRAGGTRSILLVLQGMDTAGKGGIVRHVVGMVDPQGVDHASFGKPTAEELSHHYLWRIRKALPRAGQIGVFDRSHYEDVLIVRVENLVPPEEWNERYDEINAFETELVAQGTAIVKVALMVSLDEQKERLQERLARPDKYWKYNPADLDARAKWPAYRDAYQAMLERTSTEVAPWFVVPADRKWFARLAVAELLLDSLERFGLRWPAADFDVETEQARVAAS